MPQFSGGCLCGKVRYKSDADPSFVGICHCRNCQKTTGSAFAVVVAVAQSELALQGQLKSFTDKGDSGKKLYRRFCPGCGSAVLDEAEAMPGVVMLNAGTLDDPSWVRPTMQIYCDSAQPWVQLGGGLMKTFPKMPR